MLVGIDGVVGDTEEYWCISLMDDYWISRIFVSPSVRLVNGDKLSNACRLCLLMEDDSQAGSEPGVVGAGHGAAACKSS